MTQFIPSPKGNGFSCCDIIKEVMDEVMINGTSNINKDYLRVMNLWQKPIGLPMG